MRRLLLAVLLATAAAPVAAQEAPDAIKAPDPRATIGAPAGPPVSGAELDRRTVEIAALLRCPVCQGLSVGDSPSSMAVKMKAQVRDLVAAGYDAEQVLTYFERSYGEFVRLKPPLRGVNWLVWVGPVVALAGGVLVVRHALRRGAAAPPASPTAPDALLQDPELAPYVLRVRELAYGWPGGVRPEPPA